MIMDRIGLLFGRVLACLNRMCLLLKLAGVLMMFGAVM